MQNSTVLAIDLAKHVFQVVKTTGYGKAVFSKKMNRAELKELLRKEPKSMVVMEACGGSHYWCRLAESFGHQVKALPARQVKPFRQGQKTDANDAVAIATAARQPHLKPARVLSEEEQGLQCIEKMRELQIAHKTALSNQLRGLSVDSPEGVHIRYRQAKRRRTRPPYSMTTTCFWQRSYPFAQKHPAVAWF